MNSKKIAQAHEKNTIPGSKLEEILINDGWIKRIHFFLRYEAIDWRKRRGKEQTCDSEKEMAG
jgi:hypothetical protein